MARLNLSKLGNTPFQQLLGHNKTILNAWTMLEDTLFTSSTFTTELKEEIRRTLAFLNGCSYCMAKGMPSHYHTDTRTSIAVSFAKQYAKIIIILKIVFFTLLNENLPQKKFRNCVPSYALSVLVKTLVFYSILLQVVL